MKTRKDRPVTGGATPLVRVAEAMALAGGAIVIVMAFFTTVGVSWRVVVGRSIIGDFEIVEVLSAWSVFLFFPYAQVVRQHVAVDFVSDRLPAGIVRRLAPAIDLLIAATAAFVCWRIYEGMLDTFEYDEVTMMLRMPIWVVYVPAILGWAGMAVVAFGQALGLIPEVEKPGGDAA